MAQKLRFANKRFKWIGEPKKALPLWGQHLQGKGKLIIITEGEIDALSMSQVEECRWPAVSLPDGASSAKKAISAALPWLMGFEKIILLFDDDEAGRLATEAAASILPPGRVYLANLPGFKDANEALLSKEFGMLSKCKWAARQYRPDGLVTGEALWEVVTKAPPESPMSYPWKGLDEMFKGIRDREIVTLTAGSGTGKSSVCKEIAHHLMKEGRTIGYVGLEESVQRTSLGLMGIALNKPLHLSEVYKETPIAELREGFDRTIGTDRVILYDHFGSLDPDILMTQLRFMVNGLGCDYLFFDHLTILMSAFGEGRDERKLIDKTMTELRSFTEETECGLALISHLKRPEGKGHEDGAVTSLAQLRGSHAIGQLSDGVIGLERNQQDPRLKNIMGVRVLKNRHCGDTGMACYLEYKKDTGRLIEMDFAEAERLLKNEPTPDEMFPDDDDSEY